MRNILKSRDRYCECGRLKNETLIERMFFHDEGKFSWTTFGAANGYIMLWMLFLDYFYNNRAEEIVLSWSIGIIGLMIGIRPAQKGLESLGRGISGAVRGKKKEEIINTAPDVPKQTSSKIARPTDPRNVKGRWIVTLKGEFLTFAEWQQVYKVSGNNIGKYFTVSENKWNYPNVVVSEGIIRLLDRAREILGSGISCASLYRPSDNGSAHGFGLATDIQLKRIDTGKVDEQGKPIYVIDAAHGEAVAKAIQTAARDLNYQIRIAWYSYWKKDTACVHVDIAPMYFGNNGSFLKLNVRADIVNKFKREMVNGW